MLNVLLACECSGKVREAFRVLGHNAISVDLQPADDGSEYHIQGDALKALELCEWDLLIAHPVCQYLTVSGNKWVKDQAPRKSGALVGAERRAAREEGIAFFMAFINAPIKHICVENPIGVMSTRYRKPNQVAQPWMFGHGETKANCYWLKGLPNLEPTNIVGGREQRLHLLPPTKDRAKKRSETYQGIAKAMAQQWSTHILKGLKNGD